MRGVDEKVAVEREGGRVNYMHEDWQTFTCFSRAATRYLALHVNFATDIHSTESKSGQLS